MSNDRLLDMNAPPEGTSWLKSGLASLGSASRAVLLGATALVSVCAADPAGAQEKMTTPAPAPQQPNILFIMGDDIGWMQPSIYHEGLAVGETPNIDRIGHDGAKFMTYYAEQSCTAGRTAFITGMQPVRVGMISTGNSGQPLLSADWHTDARKVPARSRLHHRRVRQEPSRRYHRVAPHGEWLPGILGLPVPPRCHAAGELPRHQQIPDGADDRTTLQKHADPGLG